MKKDTAPIVEIFSSMQGEGKHIGYPSIFVRFWGCNLRCRFDGVECDTPYAVYKEYDKAMHKTPEEVMKEIINNHTPTNIVFTGGEPLLYQEFIAKLMMLLIKHNNEYTGEVETNGTIPLSGNKMRILINLFTISQKLKNSNQDKTHEKNRINNVALKSYPPHKSYFKFVIKKEEDLREVEEFKAKHPNIEIYLMPEGRTREEILAHAPEIAKICIEHNYKYSPREHILIWSNQRSK